MEPEVTQTTSPDALQQWWTETDFTGKQYTTLLNDGSLQLCATVVAPARTLATLTAEKADATVQALLSKYSEVKVRVEDLQTEWGAAEDKMKLAGKVSRVYDYILNAPAIGDFEPLQAAVLAMVKVVQDAFEENEKVRQALVERAEALKDSTEWRETTAAFKTINEEWRQAGPTEKTNQDAMWARIEKARDVFYENKRAAHEEQEKDMLQNLDLKLEIVDKAEKLAATDSWKKSTEVFKTLMDEWKAIGRTMPEKNEALWQRFMAAKSVFFERKRQHYEGIKQEQEGNLGGKIALVEQAEALADSTDWNKTTNAYAAIMEDWKKSGRVPAEKADELWDRLQAAKDKFYGARRAHFEEVKVDQDDNFAQKQALVNRIEKIKNSSDWRETTIEMNELMDEWKLIGHVSRKHGDELWETFIAARRHFFDRKDADRDKRKGQMEKGKLDRLHQTRQFHQTLVSELQEDIINIKDFEESLERLPEEGGHKKDAEIRAHLTRLIADTQKNLNKKEQKIAEVAEQLKSLERSSQRQEPKDDKRKEERPKREFKTEGDQGQKSSLPEPKPTEDMNEEQSNTEGVLPVEQTPPTFPIAADKENEMESSGEKEMGETTENAAIEVNEAPSGNAPPTYETPSIPHNEESSEAAGGTSSMKSQETGENDPEQEPKAE